MLCKDFEQLIHFSFPAVSGSHFNPGADLIGGVLFYCLSDELGKLGVIFGNVTDIPERIIGG